MKSLIKILATAEERWEAATGFESSVGRKNVLQLIQLRWIAVIGQITTISIVKLIFHIPLPTPQMLEVLACLIAFNIASELRWHETDVVRNGELFLALLVDVGILTAQLYLSGGTTNPFAFLYLLQVIISAVLLEAWSTWTIIAITSLCLAGLSVFSEPLALPPGQGNNLSGLYVSGLLICFIIDAALLVIFITRIGRNLRTGEVQLADLRQRATEEDHIVRMGLLASGAAHELGTPLATLSVILGDWQRMPEFSRNDELKREINVMQTQLQRCKTIISGILLSAGEVRGESSVKTTLNTFLNDLTIEWSTTRPVGQFVVKNDIQHDIPVVFDSALKQMIFNVLDNAVEASPHWVKLEASCDNDALSLLITDAGPGFLPAMLNNFAKPYQSSKGRTGSGLGLFFVVNVARKLGGSVTASNRVPTNMKKCTKPCITPCLNPCTNAQRAQQTGAMVWLTLPLAAIRFDKISLAEVPHHVN
jgi:two-component system sensor histidine kinase RegB